MRRDRTAGGITPLKHPKSATVRQLAANTRLLHEVGLHVFPAMLFRTHEGHAQWAVGQRPDGKLGPHAQHERMKQPCIRSARLGSWSLALRPKSTHAGREPV